MRKKDETLRPIILDLARDIIKSKGVDHLNIRTIAQRANIATGTIYNYFAGKDEILLALTEEYWASTLLEMNDIIQKTTFYEELEEIYIFLSKKLRESAGTLMKSLGNVEPLGRERMNFMEHRLVTILITFMERDSSIRKDIWDETFTKRKYASFITMNIMFLLKTRSDNISFFIEIVKRTLY